MADILQYRIPNKSIVSLTGNFCELNDSTSYEGFIVGDFALKKVYGFMVADEEGSIHYSRVAPRVYEKTEYLHLAEKFINETRNGDLNKVILSRVEHVVGQWEAATIFEKLEANYPTAFVYLISSEKFGTWIGATPEVILRGKANSYSTVALAGTKLFNDDSPWRKKEVEEQQYVSDFINKTIQTKDQAATVVSSGPFEKVSGPVKHLNTDFQFESRVAPWELIRALHPSPAVSGIPKEQAVDFILENESHDRSLYSGVIGVIGSDTDMFVNLRCMQLFENEACLYVGGGITEYSDAEEEWQETKNKALTLTSVLENG